MKTEVTQDALSVTDDVWAILSNALNDVVYSETASNTIVLDLNTGGQFLITVEEVVGD